MEKTDTQLPFYDNMTNKEGNKIFMNIYSKLLELKISPLNMLVPNQTNQSVALKILHFHLHVESAQLLKKIV